MYHMSKKIIKLTHIYIVCFYRRIIILEKFTSMTQGFINKIHIKETNKIDFTKTNNNNIKKISRRRLG